MNRSFNCVVQLTFDDSQVHDHLLVVEDPVDVHPAAVRPGIRPPHVQDVQVHLSVQDVPRQPVTIRHLQQSGRWFRVT